MTRVVVSQPMVFPWVGQFEQVRSADIYVHYDDVQLPLGRSFITRVQLKNAKGFQWLTLPIARGRHLKKINESVTNDFRDWRNDHLRTLRELYSRAPYCREMLELVEDVYDCGDNNLAELNVRGIERVARYFDIECAFRVSSALNIAGSRSERLLAMVHALGGSIYVTGHGARHYLDHEIFERGDVRVEYMQYQRNPYRQLYGEFNPFVSVLDLIADLGVDGRRVIASSSIHWKEFLA